jgi:8-oxo-dGTP pyrophosphatase MutT (NUDIX family)
VGAKHSVSVAAVVVNEDGHVLVTQRRDNGHWEPPGGVLELGESVLDCVKREVQEETGYQIEPDRLTGVYKNMPRGIVALVFRAQLAGGQSTVSDETISIQWWTPKQVSERMIEAYSIRILDALHEGPPAVRIHDGTRLIAR